MLDKDVVQHHNTTYNTQHNTGVLRQRQLQYLPRRRVARIGSVLLADVAPAINEVNNEFNSTQLMLLKNDCNTYTRLLLRALALPCDVL